MSTNNATLAQAKHFLTLLAQKNPSKKNLNFLFESGFLSDLLDADLSKVDRDEFRRLLMLPPQVFRGKLTVKMNREMRGLESLISVCNFDWVRGDFVSEFPNNLTYYSEDQTMDFEIVRLGYEINPRAAATKLSKHTPIPEESTNDHLSYIQRGPADIQELLAFGEMFPEVQKQFKIVALGPVRENRGMYRVPFLGTCSEGRSLDLLTCSTLDSDCRFLVVTHKAGCNEYS